MSLVTVSQDRKDSKDTIHKTETDITENASLKQLQKAGKKLII